MSKKQVRGLLDYIEAIDSDEEWEFAPNSETFVHGMGFGASAEATRWAYKGFLAESKASKRAGRKKLAEHENIDCERAQIIWLYVHMFRNQLGTKPKNRHLISTMQRLGQTDKRIAKLFPTSHARLESSVSRGKKLLEINENWESKVCEELMLD